MYYCVSMVTKAPQRFPVLQQLVLFSMTYVITYDSFQSFWSQGQMKPKGSVASFPGPHPASHTAYCTVKWERAWYIFSHEWHHGQDKLCKCECHVNHKQLCPHAHTRAQLFRVKDGSTRRHFYVALHETVGRTESFTKPRQWRHTATI